MASPKKYALFATLFAALAAAAVLTALLCFLYNTRAVQTTLQSSHDGDKSSHQAPQQIIDKHVTATAPGCAFARDSYVQSHYMLLSQCRLETAR